MLLETHPDSALLILKGIDPKLLNGRSMIARYALLMSMALDKNYVDTTTFEVIQPAIDYYLSNGNPNEKLRTYYYQGRIYQNADESNNALNSFIKGVSISDECTDSLCLARLYVSMGLVYDDFYDFDAYTSCFLKAAEIYETHQMSLQLVDCYVNILNGAVLTENRSLCDSIIDVYENSNLINEDLKNRLIGVKMSYMIKFASDEELLRFIEIKENCENLDINGYLTLANAYNRLGRNSDAINAIKLIDQSGIEYDTLKYQAVYYPILKDLGEYKGALDVYEDFSSRVENNYVLNFAQKAEITKSRYEFELKTHHENVRKSRIIWGCICGIIILTMSVLILLLLVRSHRVKKELAYEKIRVKESENAKLESEKEKLALETENLAHRVETLENESESLKAIIDAHEELPSEVQNAIQIRIEMLNSLLASYITSNEQYGRSYDQWVKNLTEDTVEFMNSNRLAFQATHPRFIQYFEEHGLTIDEVNYVCLYAIGLRGKEVGNYMKKRSHVNISSAIRKKLGIDKHETNIGIYVRKLLKEL